MVRGTGAGTVSPAATAATAQHKVGAAVRERLRKRHGGTTQSQTQTQSRLANSCRPRRTRHRGATHLDTHTARPHRKWQSWQALEVEVEATRSTVPARAADAALARNVLSAGSPALHVRLQNQSIEATLDGATSRTIVPDCYANRWPQTLHAAQVRPSPKASRLGLGAPSQTRRCPGKPPESPDERRARGHCAARPELDKSPQG